MKKIRKKFFYGSENNCDVSCPSLISNGLGRWTNGKWKSFSQGKLCSFTSFKKLFLPFWLRRFTYIENLS